MIRHLLRSPGARRATLVASASGLALLAAASVATAQPIEPAADMLVPQTPCTVSARACVDLDNREAWLIESGKVVRGPVPMRDGLEGDTPRGAFGVEWKTERWTSRELGTSMPYSVFFAPGGIAFHEGAFDTPSAGCVKLDKVDAVAFYTFLQVGDEVQIR